MNSLNAGGLVNLLRSLPINDIWITIIGAGRIGGNIAESLYASGLSHQILIDSDKITKSNIRSDGMPLFYRKDVGKYKVDALARNISYQYKNCVQGDSEIRAYRSFISPSTTARELEKLFDYSIIVIWAIDSIRGLLTLERTNILHTTSRIHFVTAMHGGTGGGHVVFWIPFMTPCPLHSLGLDSFREITETPASRSRIDLGDIEVVAESTAEIVRSMVFKKTGGYLSRISLFDSFDLNRGNYLHIERLENGYYRKHWLKSHFGADCIMCSR